MIWIRLIASFVEHPSRTNWEAAGIVIPSQRESTRLQNLAVPFSKNNQNQSSSSIISHSPSLSWQVLLDGWLPHTQQSLSRLSLSLWLCSSPMVSTHWAERHPFIFGITNKHNLYIYVYIIIHPGFLLLWTVVWPVILPVVVTTTPPLPPWVWGECL